MNEILEKLYAICLLAGSAYALLVLSVGMRWGGRLQKLFHLKSRGFSKASAKKAAVLNAALALMIFGVTGLVLSRSMQTNFIVAALLAGAITAVLSSGLWKLITKNLLTEPHLLKGESWTGKIGKVVLAIPAEGSGSIALVAEGKRVVMPAQGLRGQSIEKGARVLIISVGPFAIVEPY